MNNLAPNERKILMIAGIFGLLTWLMSLIAWDYSFFGALFFGIVIAAIVAAILWFVWRSTDADGSAQGHQSSQASASAAPAPTPAPAAVAPVPAADPTPAPVAKAAPAAPAPTEPKVKSGTILPGEAELSDRKGDWKYEGDADAPVAEEKPTAKKPAAKKPAAKAKAAPETVADKDYDGDGVIEGENEGSKPATLTAARDGGPDDLKQIKGVGPKMEGMLHGMGFFHFDQVAAWTGDEVAWVDANLKGFKGRVSRDNWVDQAKTLAAGGETAFSKKVEKGGVY